MSLKDRHRSITMRGLVCATEWDSDGNPSKVSIFTFDEDEYEIEPRGAGSYLLDHTGQEVMVRGHLAPDYRRRKVVLVKSFTVFGTDAVTVDIDAELRSNRDLHPRSAKLVCSAEGGGDSHERRNHLRSRKHEGRDGDEPIDEKSARP